MSSQTDEESKEMLAQLLKRRIICTTLSLLRPLNITKSLMEECEKMVEVLKIFITDIKPHVFVLHISQLMEDLYSTMRKLGKFLELQCEESYLKTIAKHTFQTNSQSRFNVEWNEKFYESVYRLNDKYAHFYKRFTFLD